MKILTKMLPFLLRVCLWISGVRSKLESGVGGQPLVVWTIKNFAATNSGSKKSDLLKKLFFPVFLLGTGAVPTHSGWPK